MTPAELARTRTDVEHAANQARADLALIEAIRRAIRHEDARREAGR